MKLTELYIDLLRTGIAQIATMNESERVGFERHLQITLSNLEAEVKNNVVLDSVSGIISDLGKINRWDIDTQSGDQMISMEINNEDGEFIEYDDLDKVLSNYR